MAGTYTQLYVQIVFAVKGRKNLISEDWDQELYKYISGIITGKGQKSVIVNGASDHIHVFVGIKPTTSISDLVRDIKNNSSKFINENGFLKEKFNWQAGYGAFTYSQSQVSRVYKYIDNQKSHHQKKTFKQEYVDFLKKYEIEFDDKFLFEWYD